MFRISHTLKACLLMVGLLLGATSCDRYLDINESPNSPSEITNLDLILADITGTTSYNLVGGGNLTRYSAFWIQHTADNSTPPSIDTYRFNTSDFNNEWEFSSYTSVLANSKYVIEKGTELQSWNHVAIAQILMAHNYALLSDYWGDIPFSEALRRSGNIKPKFDPQAQVYDGVFALLDDAIENIEKEAPLAVGGGDFYLGGDMDGWKKLAYSLKARYHLRLVKAPGKNAQTQADLALAALANGLQSSSDNVAFHYLGDPGAEAPWFQWVDKFQNNLSVSKHFVDLLVANQDPRLPLMVAQNDNNAYVGHINGGTPVPLGQVSTLGDLYLAEEQFTPLLTYHEVKFMEAEAHFLKNNATAAEAAYKAAIQANMEYLSDMDESRNITQTQIDDYIAAHPYNGLQSIITQKYIAGFVFGASEAYTDYRRTGFPNTLVPVPNGDVPQIPTRLPYPDTEINNNLANVPSGVTRTSKVWWDVD